MSDGKIYVKINTGEQTLEFSKGYVSNERDYIITCLKQIIRNTAIDRQIISKNLKKIKEDEINHTFNCGYIIITSLYNSKYSYYTYSESLYY